MFRHPEGWTAGVRCDGGGDDGGGGDGGGGVDGDDDKQDNEEEEERKRLNDVSGSPHWLRLRWETLERHSDEGQNQPASSRVKDGFCRPFTFGFHFFKHSLFRSLVSMSSK